MADRPIRLHHQQRMFAAYLRCTGAATPPPGMDPVRLAMLKQMQLTDFNDLIGSCFPRCVHLLGESDWSLLTRHYFTTHCCRTPLFSRVAAEFVHWLVDLDNPPHPALPELAHLEWRQIALLQSNAPVLAPQPAVDDLLQTCLQRSALAWLLEYQWPVHDAAALATSARPPSAPTRLLLQRDASGRVSLCPLGAAAAQLLRDVGGHPGMQGRAYIQRLARWCGASYAELSAPAHGLLLQAWGQRTLGGVDVT